MTSVQPPEATSTTPPASKKSRATPAPNHYAFQPLSKLAKSLADGEITSRSLLELFLSRIERLDHRDDNTTTNNNNNGDEKEDKGGINAVITRDFTRAREHADAADDLYRRFTAAQKNNPPPSPPAKLPPLHGIPITLKESHNVRHLPTTLGNPLLLPSPPSPTSSSVHTSLRTAGAILIGKTALPLHQCDYQSYNAIHGTCRNPWSLDCTPGGSSGGSAAVLAAGMSAAEVGSDIGGSIRLPAGFCGVWGLKPTHGLVDNGGSRSGKVGPVDLSVVGPMGRCAEDLELVLDALLGKEGGGGRGGEYGDRGGGYAGGLRRLEEGRRKIDKLRIAVWPDAPGTDFAVDVYTKRAVAKTVSALRSAGCTVVEIDGPGGGFTTQDIWDIYVDMLCGVYAGRMSDEDYAEAERLAGLEREGNGEGKTGRFWCRQTMDAREWAMANEKRWKLIHAFEDLFSGRRCNNADADADDTNANTNTNTDRGFDAMLCPLALTPAFPHDHTPAVRPFFTPSDRTLHVEGVRDDAPYNANAFWAGVANCPLLPSVAFPVDLAEVSSQGGGGGGNEKGGKVRRRLPVGLQLVGPRFHDYVCIEVAGMVAREIHGGNDFMPLGYPPGCE